MTCRISRQKAKCIATAFNLIPCIPHLQSHPTLPDSRYNPLLNYWQSVNDPPCGTTLERTLPIHYLQRNQPGQPFQNRNCQKEGATVLLIVSASLWRTEEAGIDKATNHTSVLCWYGPYTILRIVSLYISHSTREDSTEKGMSTTEKKLGWFDSFGRVCSPVNCKEASTVNNS